MFSLTELEIGKVLGIGGFGVVCEITGITLSDTSATESDNEAITKIMGNIEAEEDHYDISTARELTSRRCIRNGDARYAVKRLKKDLDDFQTARGRIDLAIEVRYLHALSHPNIVKMRGVFKTDDPFDPDFFFVMDRLYGTLEDRFVEWRATMKKNKRGLLRNMLARKTGKADSSKDLLIDRLVVAYDIAAAFRYMHDHKLVYRDMKPENMGFDVRGNVKIFDFGLAKAPNPELRNKYGLYHLTGQTGSIPYMAPEVAMTEPYNEKCDVYSLGILLWEIVSLELAFVALVKSPHDYLKQVVIGQARPPIGRKWPLLTEQAMKSAWKQSPMERPSMKKMCVMLRADLDDMTTEESVRSRTKHMIDISNKSSC
jgi:serine/threonine protein kinase